MRRKIKKVVRNIALGSIVAIVLAVFVLFVRSEYMPKGELSLIGFTSGVRGTSTQLIGDKYYAYPKGGSPGMEFTSGRSYLLNDAGFLETWGNTCPPATSSGKWVLIGKGYINGFEVPISCASSGVNFAIDTAALAAAGFQFTNPRWPGDTYVTQSAEMTYQLEGVPKPLDIEIGEVFAPEEVRMGDRFTVTGTLQVLNQNCEECVIETTLDTSRGAEQDALSILMGKSEVSACGNPQSSGIKFKAGAGDYLKFELVIPADVELEGKWSIPVRAYDKCGGTLFDTERVNLIIKEKEFDCSAPITGCGEICGKVIDCWTPPDEDEKPVDPDEIPDDITDDETIPPDEPVVVGPGEDSNIDEIPAPIIEKSVFVRFWEWLKSIFS